MKQYVFLREAERAHRELSIEGKLLSDGALPAKAGAAIREPAKLTAPMAAKVEFYRHQLGEDEAASWRRVLDTLFLTLGPQVAAFEQELGRYLVRGPTGRDAAARRGDQLVLDGPAHRPPGARRGPRATRSSRRR